MLFLSSTGLYLHFSFSFLFKIGEATLWERYVILEPHSIISGKELEDGALGEMVCGVLARTADQGKRGQVCDLPTFITWCFAQCLAHSMCLIQLYSMSE